MTIVTLFQRFRDLSFDASVELEDAVGRRSLHDVLASSRAFLAELEASHGALEHQHVLLQGEPSAAWLVAFLAITRAGGVAVPVALRVPEPELRYFAEDSGAKLAVVTHDHESLFPASVSVVRKDRIADPALGALETDELPGPSDPALILYTSGTTGKPKGAVLTHANLATQTAALREAWGFRDRDVLLHTLPMHHLHGIVVALLTAVSAPASVIMLPHFDPLKVFHELSRATVLMAVPTMYQRLVEAFDAEDEATRARFAEAASRLRLATSGSAALPRSLAERWRSIGGVIPLERYGMTEVGIALSNSLAPEGRRTGAVGRSLPTVEARIVDEQGLDIEGPGELLIRGPSVFAGYWGRPEVTEASFRDGWFLTGDIAERDSEGVIRLKGRASVDILKSGGEKVSALEVEEVLREHPAILEVAVVGLPDDTWGDRVTAAIVARPGRAAECDEAFLRAWAKERLAPFKVPREVRLLESLPRNAMGKVVKPEIVRLLTILA